MKKTFILTISLFATLFILFCNSITVSASENSINYNKIGMGYTINSVNTEYIDSSEIKTGSPIFNTEWLNNILNSLEPELIYNSDSLSYSSHSFDEITTRLSTSLQYSDSVKGAYDIFTLNAQLGYLGSTSSQIKTAKDQYYYTFISKVDRYSYSLPNFASDLSAYKNNLNNNYLTALDNLFTTNTQNCANNFFDVYGTHLIAKGIYGGKLETYYSAFLQNSSFTTSIKNSINSGLTATISSIVSAGNFQNFSLSAIINDNNIVQNDFFRAKAYGGIPFVASSFTALNNNYQSWIAAIDNYPSLTRTSSDGLIPLWNLLPSKYDSSFYRDKMKGWFEQYAKEYNYSVYRQYLPNTYLATDYKLVRSQVYRIDDSGRFVHNKHDIINLNTFSKLSYLDLASVGYSSIDVYIQITMKEIYKGYPYICIYNNVCENMTDAQKDSHKVCPDIKYTGDISSAVTLFFSFTNIPIAKFNETNQIVLRYGASGSGEDDWENWNLYVKLVYKK